MSVGGEHLAQQPAAMPADRPAIRRRAVWTVALGLAFVAAGLYTAMTTEESKGWVAAVPERLRPVLGLLGAAMGLAFALPSLAWIVYPLRGPRSPAVRFEQAQLVIRNPMIPKTFVVDLALIVLVKIDQQRWLDERDRRHRPK